METLDNIEVIENIESIETEDHEGQICIDGIWHDEGECCYIQEIQDFALQDECVFSR